MKVYDDLSINEYLTKIKVHKTYYNLRIFLQDEDYFNVSTGFVDPTMAYTGNYYTNLDNEGLQETNQHFLFEKKRDFILNKIKFDQTLNSDDKVYIAPGVTFPRDKFRTWAFKYNISLKRKWEEADKIVVDSNILKGLIQTLVTTTILHLRHKNYNYEIKVLIMRSMDTVEEGLNSVNHNWEVLKIKEGYWHRSYHFTKAEQKVLKTIFDVIHKGLITNFVPVKWLHENCHNEVVLDYDQYSNLYDLIITGDEDNVTLATQAISAVNIKESLPFLGPLILGLNHILSYAPVYNTVRFKALKSYVEEAFGYAHFPVNKQEALLKAISICQKKLLLKEEEGESNQIPSSVFYEMIENKVKSIVQDAFTNYFYKGMAKNVNMDFTITLNSDYEKKMDGIKTICINNIEVVDN